MEWKTVLPPERSPISQSDFKPNSASQTFTWAWNTFHGELNASQKFLNLLKLLILGIHEPSILEKEKCDCLIFIFKRTTDAIYFYEVAGLFLFTLPYRWNWKFMKVHKNKQIRRKMTRSIKLKKKRKSRISKYIKKR